MTSPSFTSNSDGCVMGPEPVATPLDARVWNLRSRRSGRRGSIRRVCAMAGRAPAGVLALVLMLALHLVLVSFVYPHPIAREGLRVKVLALTAHSRPAVIIAGDSRAEHQLVCD